MADCPPDGHEVLQVRQSWKDLDDSAKKYGHTAGGMTIVIMKF